MEHGKRIRRSYRLGAIEENKGGRRRMTYAIELHIDMEEVEGNMEIINVKAKHRGLLFWHNITVKQLKDLICKEEEE